MQKMRKNTRLIRAVAAIVIAAVVVGLDQLTKMLVASNMEPGESVTLIPGVLRLTYITNPAAAMGLFENSRWLFMILSPIAVIGILVYLGLSERVGKLLTVALSMIAGGGLGNMIDRTFYGTSFGNGEVIDFVDFCAFPKIWHYIFNVADAFVCIGAGLFALAVILDAVSERKAAKKSEPRSGNAPSANGLPECADAGEPAAESKADEDSSLPSSDPENKADTL